MLLVLCFDGFFIIIIIIIIICTLRELGTSIFALNNINKRKYGVSKLGIIFYDYLKIIRNKGAGVREFHIPFWNKNAGTRKLRKLKKPGKCVNAKLTELSLSNYKF